MSFLSLGGSSPPLFPDNVASVKSKVGRIYFGTTVLTSSGDHVDVNPQILGLDFAMGGGDVLLVCNGDIVQAVHFSTPTRFGDGFVVRFLDMQTGAAKFISGSVRINYMYLRSD